MGSCMSKTPQFDIDLDHNSCLNHLFCCFKSHSKCKISCCSTINESPKHNHQTSSQSDSDSG